MSGRRQLSVVVVDDHDLLGEALIVALRNMSFAAQRIRVHSARQILSDLTWPLPGIALLDLDLGQDGDHQPIDGVALVGRLCARGWRVVIVSGSRNRVQIASAIASGASGFFSKAAPLADLARAVGVLAEGRPLMTEAERAHWTELHRRAEGLRTASDNRLARLSARESEVLALLARGMRVAAIADRFVVSESTVRTQVKSILRKLEVNSQIEAVALHRAAGR